MTIQLDTIITCPHCGFAKREQMPRTRESSFTNAPVAAQYYVPSQGYVASFVRMQTATARPSRGKTRKEQSRATISDYPSSFSIELYDRLDQSNRKVWQAEV